MLHVWKITICSGQLLPVTIQEELEDTIEVIRIRKSMDRQHNGKKKNDKGTNIDLQILSLKLKTKRTPLQSGGGLMFSGREGSSCSTSGTRSYLLSPLFHFQSVNRLTPPAYMCKADPSSSRLCGTKILFNVLNVYLSFLE